MIVGLLVACASGVSLSIVLLTDRTSFVFHHGFALGRVGVKQAWSGAHLEAFP